MRAPCEFGHETSHSAAPGAIEAVYQAPHSRVGRKVASCWLVTETAIARALERQRKRRINSVTAAPWSSFVELPSRT